MVSCGLHSEDYQNSVYKSLVCINKRHSILTASHLVRLVRAVEVMIADLRKNHIQKSVLALDLQTTAKSFPKILPTNLARVDAFLAVGAFEPPTGTDQRSSQAIA